MQNSDNNQYETDNHHDNSDLLKTDDGPQDDIDQSTIFHIKDLVTPAFKMILDLYHNKSTAEIPTGFHGLDKLIGGLRKGELFVLASRPAVGKSLFVQEIIYNITIRKKLAGVALFNMEMDELMTVCRFFSILTGFSYDDVKNKKICPADLNKFTLAANSLQEAPIIIDSQAKLKVSQLEAKTAIIKYQHNVDVIVIDYLQLLQPESGNIKYGEQTKIVSRTLKNIARKLDLAVIALVQLNCHPDKIEADDIQNLDLLADYQVLEQDADIVTFLHRDKQKCYTYKEQIDGVPAQLIIGKNRNGKTGVVDLLYLPKRMLFADRVHRYTKEDFPSKTKK